jgi:hypothetical protein
MSSAFKLQFLEIGPLPKIAKLAIDPLTQLEDAARVFVF